MLSLQLAFYSLVKLLRFSEATEWRMFVESWGRERQLGNESIAPVYQFSIYIENLVNLMRLTSLLHARCVLYWFFPYSLRWSMFRKSRFCVENQFCETLIPLHFPVERERYWKPFHSSRLVASAYGLATEKKKFTTCVRHVSCLASVEFGSALDELIFYERGAS